jgi:hypothetical protein
MPGRGPLTHDETSPLGNTQRSPCVKRGQHYLLVIGFLAVVAAVGPFQAIGELREGETPQVLDLFRRAPTLPNLRSFEKDLENQSSVTAAIRPHMQYLRFLAFRDTGEQALVGRRAWWFYRPDARFLTERCPDQPTSQTGPRAATSAIISFRDQLARRGIHLLVVPVPGKPSVYPDMITRRAVPCDQRCHEHTRRVLGGLAAAGVEAIDLLDLFAEARAAARPGQAGAWYLARDTHWTNDGARLAAEAVARRIRSLGWAPAGEVRYNLQSTAVLRMGDVLQMLKCPPVETLFEPEQVHCLQVVKQDDGKPYRDDPASPILVLGDSFLRIYERDEPGSAGFIAHLAYELDQPLASIVNDGGASTLVRQGLSRKPGLLEGKKLVIWEFVERDIRFGTEGWQDVPLPETAADHRSGGDAATGRPG